MALGKSSARKDPYETLQEAAEEKQRKYQALGSFFYPIILSAGGLMEKQTAKTYKNLQALIGPVGSSWLSIQIAIILAKTRANSAISISQESPITRETSWRTTRALNKA